MIQNLPNSATCGEVGAIGQPLGAFCQRTSGVMGGYEQ